MFDVMSRPTKMKNSQQRQREKRERESEIRNYAEACEVFM